MRGEARSAIQSRALWVTELDVANPPTRLTPNAPGPRGPYRAARVLARFQGEPIGMLTVGLGPDGEVDIEAASAEALDRFTDRFARVAPDGWTPGSPALPAVSDELEQLRAATDLPAISVVIGTRKRPDQVVECIELVLKQDYPSPVEIIVVHNGGDGTPTAEAIAGSFPGDDRIRYLEETRPGLSRARNIGLSAAQHPVTAFLSDDIRVDSLWLLGIARGFKRDENVHCVTGFCPPMYLDTAEQLMFESSMAWGTRQGFKPVLYGFEHSEDPLHPYRAGSFVNGSNMSYDTKVFRAMGGFDETLGPGTIARGGEDLDAPIRILADGGLIAFEPAVIGWHADRYDDRSFTRHMYTYGLGLTAFLAKHVLEGSTREAVMVRIPHGIPSLLKSFAEQDEALKHEVPVPLRYHLAHLVGRVAGPFAYLRSRWAGRH
jgi:glycosyltransferase involved in cell wall biosynthesis